MKFYKYHGLGNDYIVLPPAEVGGQLSDERIRLICDRNFGVGGDGILFGPFVKDGCEFALRIFNPDGSEAEKSGNGLRIFARFLHDRGKVGAGPFEILTKGGLVRAQVHDGGTSVTVEMGKVSFRCDDYGNVHVPVGKRNFEPEKLAENIQAFVTHIVSLKPNAAKGVYLQKVVVTTTMGPGVPLSFSL